MLGVVACVSGDADFSVTTQQIGETSDLLTASDPVGYWRLGDTVYEASDETENRIAGHYFIDSGSISINVGPGAIARDPDTCVQFHGAATWVEVPDR